MRITQDGIRLTKRNQHIRLHIAESLIMMMKKKQLEDITITELVKEAHVSRMTFYKYYRTKTCVLQDYMYEMVSAYMLDVEQKPEIGGFHERAHILHCFEFFREYREFAHVLILSGLQYIITNALNDYMDTYMTSDGNDAKYKLYYYAGAICNVYLKWVENECAESPEELTDMIYKILQK